ncbi:MAG: alpha-1,2-fucosyltransferase [Candidatus Paceibacterota bacterium]
MIIVRLAGGMGNQMFQYAAGNVLAMKNNVPLGLDTSFLLDRTPIPNFTFREYNLGEFNIDARVVKNKEVPFLYRHHFSGMLMRYGDYVRRKFFNSPGKERKEYSFDVRVLSLGPDAYLEGWWQNPAYFSDSREILLKDFTLKHPSEKITRLVADISSEHSVCVHVRRGDYLGNTFHETVGVDYYKKAIETIATTRKIERIYVFDRDSIEWCEENLLFDYPTRYIKNDISMAECLTLMKSCRHLVLANSSLSWWAGWLGNGQDKIVVAPKKWVNDTSVNTEEVIPKEWIRI